MKRISKIEIENARAYYDRIPIQLEKGENLLLYGENGSGKTSLYKSLNDFIQSFYTRVSYTPNRYKAAGDLGEVMLSIGDFDPNTQLFSNEVDYRFGVGVDNTNVQNTGFMKSLALSKGFLNYRDLLKVYLYDETDPNLFDFFVEHLLGNHVPLAQGLQKALAKEWYELNHDITDVYHRQEHRHHKGLRRLGEYEVVLRSVLDSLFAEVNKYLGQYFKNFGLTIGYDLQPMTFSYGNWKGEWKVKHDLRLKITLGNDDIAGYTEGLNEARLSAIAICLYLAALKANPGSELKLMFLDDIFIGIDSANRWPILEILENEFREFQIVIATYDRSWYCLARNFLLKHAPDRWKFVNLFTLPKEVNGKKLLVPVLTNGVSSFDKAKEYLHGQRPIDLPAAANYFRKALEELISEKNLPKELFINNAFTMIPGFKLTQRAEALGKLFAAIGEDTKYISDIESYLHPLIHPLSHYEEEAQVYREELISVEEAIVGLTAQISTFKKKCRLLAGKKNDLCIQYNTADGTYKSKYFVRLDDNLWLYKDAAGNAKLTACKCKTILMEGELNGVELDRFYPSGNTHFKYESLEDAMQQIYDYEMNSKHHNVVAGNDYDIVFFCEDLKVKKCIQLKRNALFAAMQ